MPSETSPSAFADKIEGTPNGYPTIGTPGDDKISSGDDNDINLGDASVGDGSGDDKINSGQGDDELTGNVGADKFLCGSGDDDTVYGFNPEEGDKATRN